MKKLATILFLLLSIATTQTFASTGATPLRPSKIVQALPSVYIAPPKYIQPFATLTNDELFYVDTVAQQFRYEFFPGSITITLDQQGTKFVDTILGYAEHFTAPYIAYLDSVKILFAVLKVATFDKNRLLINVSGQSIQNGIPYAGTLIDTASISAADLSSAITDPPTGVTLTIPLHHKRVAKDFFVSVLSAYDPTNEFTADFQNQFALFGDSLDYPTGTTFDKSIHRGYIQGAHYQLPYTGISFGQQPAFYSNFWIVAYVTNQATGVEDVKLNGNALAQNYPNPFNPSTEIRYSTSEHVYTTLKVFNALGREVKTLVDGYVDAGEHAANFVADNLPSGTYYYTLKAGSFTQTKRMVLAK